MNSILRRKSVLLGAVAVLAAAAGLWLFWNAQQNKRYAQAFYGMSTVVDQKAYGPAAQKAMAALEQEFSAFEKRLSLYEEESDVAKINANAGAAPVQVSEDTFTLLQQAKSLALSSENAFALTIAPLSLAWGITTDSPRVLSETEIKTLLPLVNDNKLALDAQAGTAFLQDAGQAIDLGGIAKGTACNVARDIYNQYGVESALLSIGGNIYAKGAKPDGSLYRIGFRDPLQDASTSIASFTMKDTVFAVSGAYERYFEQDGVRYHHIFDPKTGAPAQSDIVSVGVMHEDGTVADFYSTTLFVWGKEKALAYMRSGGVGILLDDQNNLYVSEALRDSFEMVESAHDYHIEFVG